MLRGIVLRWTEREGEGRVRVFVDTERYPALKEAELWAASHIETMAYRTKTFTPCEITEVEG